ncbi:uncharacterized protein KY384_007965 [Bacidia gigantensis]|uniref:uncharacterized protein n=1 Tax=Bacidia gigantensis TaxID=2732470 RepID=UPI001D043592|nr:uncharacterized protein KY384_007965 [Bacidia gigantensis]KAG8527811.1 hypothetical protein KY384_007965 [Bacidia gigantensis]
MVENGGQRKVLAEPNRTEQDVIGENAKTSPSRARGWPNELEDISYVTTHNKINTMAMTFQETQSSQAADVEHFDLVCVGFGPASLAIAIALHDRGIKPRVRYLERQPEFKWHAGMLLPDARMQISFIKDLATLRDPTSKFTFLNYLRCQNRLVAFTNLSTFLPLREEYNDYMTWCASHFDSQVQYGQETVSVTPTKGPSGRVESWRIVSRDMVTNEQSTVSARHVVVAVGGKPKIPAALQDLASDSRIIHSSSYSHIRPKLSSAKNIAVVGGGQSAAEIFKDLQSRLANTNITLYTGKSTLKPSDDSPFVNEVFDPDKVDTFYDLAPKIQQDTLKSNRSTNYGVVRPELLDKLYESMYHQRLHQADESKWQHRIIPWREVVGYAKQNDGTIRLKLRDTSNDTVIFGEPAFDLVFVATGYLRNAHETLLAPTQSLLETGSFVVGRDYKVRYRRDEVNDNSGIWLQGCCEGSHGVSTERNRQDLRH